MAFRRRERRNFWRALGGIGLNLWNGMKRRLWLRGGTALPFIKERLAFLRLPDGS